MAHNFSETEILGAIGGSAGVMSTIAKRLGCDWSTAVAYCKKYPSTVLALKNERETILDMAETALYKQIQAGEPWAVKWLLATVGKTRGYIEKQEVQHSGFLANKAPVIKRTIHKK